MNIFKLVGTIFVDTDKANKSLQKTDEEAEKTGKKMSGFFEKAGTAAVGFSSKVGKVALGVGAALIAMTEETREYRTEMGKLDAAYSSSGYSADTAAEAYKRLYGVIGETDQSVEAAQQIALLADSEKDVAKWSDLAAGVVGKFGDALQPETFFEAANETIKLNEATGAYVQMLEGCGMSVEDFNKGLQACSTEAEKQAYMLDITKKALGSAGDAYKKNNKDIIAANEAQDRLNSAMATFSGSIEPILTGLKNLGAFGLETLSKIGTGGQIVIATIVGIISAIAPAVTAYKKIKETVDGVKEAYSDLAPAVKDAVTSIKDAKHKFIDAELAANKTRASLYGTAGASNATTVSLYGSAAATDTYTARMRLMNNTIKGATSKILAYAAAHKVAIIAALGLAGPIIALSAYMLKTGASAEEVAVRITAFADKLADMIVSFAEGFAEASAPIIEAITSVIEAVASQLPLLVPVLIQAGIQLFMALVDSINQIVPPLVAALPQIVEAITNAIPVLIPALIEAAVTLFMAIVQAIPMIVGPILQALPQIVQAFWVGLVDGLETVWNAVKSRSLQTWENIKQAASQKWQEIKESILSPVKATSDNIGSAAEKIKSFLSFSNLAAVVENKFNDVKNKIITPIISARDKIAEIINNIKGFFNFRVSIPHVPLPHFNIKPKGWDVGDLLKGKVPSLSVKWYDKAMDKAMVLDGATIFGMNGNGEYLGGGESGREVVSGEEHLLKKIRQAVAVENSNLIQQMRSLYLVVAEYLPAILEKAGHDIYIDKRRLVASTKDEYYREIGKIVIEQGKGVK